MHRILLFEGHWYAIYSYGFLLVVAMLAGMWLATRYGRAEGLTAEQCLDFQLAALIGGLIGARVAAVLWEWPVYAGHPLEMLNIRGGGLSFQGSVLGGFIGFLWYTYRTGLSRTLLMDISTPGLILGHVIGRFGCFLNGCCFGRVTLVPWGVVFPDEGPLPRHPTQLYEAGAELVLLVALLAVRTRLPRRGGLAYAYVCLYAIERFVIDFYRQEPLLYGGLDVAQYVSLAALAVGLWALARAAAAMPPQKAESVALSSAVGG